MGYLKYGDKELNFLKSKDQRLAKEIERIGFIKRPVEPDLFRGIVNSIISQQISIKAAATIWQRLLALCGEITPQNISSISKEQLQKIGITFKKTDYIQGIAEKIIKGHLNLDELLSLADDEVIKRLVALNGIGPWTAEMLMIFSLQRPDILSWLDLGIRRGLKILHGFEELSFETFLEFKKLYSPYGTVAALYIWELSLGR